MASLGPYTGRYASVSLSSVGSTGVVVNSLGHWDVAITFDEMDASVFGSVWKQDLFGMQGWTGKVDGFMSISTVAGSTGQYELMTRMFAQTKIQDIKFYLDSTNSGSTDVIFWMPNCATQNANYSTDYGCYIGNLANAIDKNGLASISFDVTGFGAIALYCKTSSQAALVA